MSTTALAMADEQAKAFGIQDILSLPDKPLSALQATLLTSHPSMMGLANLLAGSGMVPKAYDQKPGAILVALNTSLRLGMDPLAVMQGLAVINGQPRLWGDLPLALVMRHADFADVEETLENEDQLNKLLAEEKWSDLAEMRKKGYDVDAIGARCKLFRRKPDGTIRESNWFYSIADAGRARLWARFGNGQPTPWVTSPKRMLHFRARGFSAHDLFPDALLGFIVLGEHEEREMIDGSGGPKGGAKVVSLQDRLAERANTVQETTIEGEATVTIVKPVTPADETAQRTDSAETPEAPTTATQGDTQGTLFENPSDRLRRLLDTGEVGKALVLKLARKHIDPEIRLTDLTPEHHPIILAAIDAGDEGEATE